MKSKMKTGLKYFFEWMITFAVCFAVVYAIVFFGGWKLFESGNPILIETGVALIMSFFAFVFWKTIYDLEKRIEVLEKALKNSDSDK